MSHLPSPQSPVSEAQGGANETDEPQFSADLLSVPSLPPEFRARPLLSGDYARGHLQLLAQLTTVGNVSEDMWRDRFAFLRTHNDIFFTVIIEEIASRRVVGAGSLLLDGKFVHGCSKVGHIEDVVVDGSMRGKNLGTILVQTLTELGRAQGAYKVILNCLDDRVPFYTKTGYERRGNEMAHYFH
ncbi:glucosamine 6-phosphate N-acetyltransferase [Hyaloraphidium curvatum]|nr:glucosamine 6-phosphate N-acetyltransferase [Hyaloraphidium curvatum]